MPSGSTNNFPESGRGLGHVTPSIFGNTVGYPSGSLASCYRSDGPTNSVKALKEGGYWLGIQTGLGLTRLT